MFSDPFFASIFLACLASLVCTIPGTLLMLRGVALMSDAISHTLLLGIVMTFLCAKTLHSPLLFLGAIGSGLCMVFVVERVIQTQKITEDVAIGIVFPVFFSLGVIVISCFVNDIHLDVDMVLLGDLAFAPFDRFIVQGTDYGPWGLWMLSGVLFVHLIVLFCLYYTWQYTFFDKEGASIAGISVRRVHYSLMALTAISAVAACHVVGSIVVVALMITPPAIAYFLTERMFPLLATSILIGIAATLCGYGGAQWVDVSIAGSIALAHGIFFVGVFLCTPKKGLVGRWIRNRNYRCIYARKLVEEYGEKQQMPAGDIEHIAHEFGWSVEFVRSLF
ncbi:MAG TPA: metal ABC transporter permease [Candidatus Bathyarchaeia archaeon]|nr:metal ABC transporter permease [Candidatus Bathyarchaeia archaeon]